MSPRSSADGWIARLLTEPIVFDTMIVRHLCNAGAGGALATAFAGRMLWPSAVDAELNLQAGYVRPLASFMASKPGRKIDIDAAEDDEVEEIRIDMYTKKVARASDTEHLGEAQCLFLAERDGYPIATNDGRARARARANWDDTKNAPRMAGGKKVEVFHTVDVLQAMVRLGVCKPGPAWDFYDTACARGLTDLPGYERPGSRGRFLTDASTMRAMRLADLAARTGAPSKGP